MTFKYIRSMEAVFESMPQAVLQLVYVMRTGTWEAIFIISIIQSVISMTNSVLKDDNSRGMYGNKWKKHKERFPPTLKFFQHAFSRLSQVISRICTLSLFWTVVGGLPFSIVIATEVIIAIISAIFNSKIVEPNKRFDLNDSFLFLTSIIIIPPEMVYANGELEWYEYVLPVMAVNESKCDCGVHCVDLMGVFCVGWVCCGAVSTILTSIMSCGYPCTHGDMYLWPTIKLGILFIELLLIIVFGILNEKSESEDKYLFRFEHGFGIFVLCIISYLIDCCYLRLFPNFSLPHTINPRSKWGYAFAGELTELQKLNPVLDDENNYFVQKFVQTGSFPNEPEMKQLFWDEPYLIHDDDGTIVIRDKKYTAKGSCALYAIANKHFDIVEWLESQGAKDHLIVNGNRITPQDARIKIDKDYDGWI